MIKSVTVNIVLILIVVKIHIIINANKYIYNDRLQKNDDGSLYVFILF